MDKTIRLTIKTERLMTEEEWLDYVATMKAAGAQIDFNELEQKGQLTFRAKAREDEFVETLFRFSRA